CDRILGTKDAAKFEQTLPAGQLAWVQQCGHVPHLEKATFTAECIDTFVSCL
ncbi:MAG: alpha/beta hydrolase, partial [Cyanobacteria bacterium P01_D01_bin.123]